MTKVYVEMLVKYDLEGQIQPVAMKWADGRRFRIDRVLDASPRASRKAGGVGMRYLCRIGGAERCLFHDSEGKWFVEVGEPERDYENEGC